MFHLLRPSLIEGLVFRKIVEFMNITDCISCSESVRRLAGMLGHSAEGLPRVASGPLGDE